MANHKLRRWLILAVLTAAFITLMADMTLWQQGLRYLFPQESSVVHPRASLLVLVGEHLELVGISSALTVILGLPLGIWVKPAPAAGTSCPWSLT